MADFDRRKNNPPKDTFGAGQILDKETFQQALQAQVDVSRKLNVPCAMLILKLEHQPFYAERFGSEALERVRKCFIRKVFHDVRSTDTVGWVADGCVGIILRVITARETGHVATRLQQRLAHFPVLIDGLNLHLSLEVGGVWYSGQRQLTSSDLTEQAFAALSA